MDQETEQPYGNMILNELIKDEKKNNKELYSLGPFWSHKTNSAISEIKKKD